MNVSQIGNGWVFLRHEQWQNSACDPASVLSDLLLAQARDTRLGEVAKGLGNFECDISPRREARFMCCLGEGVTRPGERISPKRDNLTLLLF
ncbi:hypothetical protein DEO72_LG8g2342 [Vigna unguiculata]|uniref:Uncharacterized protein n=1 Tax=Vigna unguiculata TaxID=3917 RepID=A0A4D6MS82_VIGUN|nr:hypothetical protein DEO72_LG8g2342 [Vigna unguiculata]